MLLAEEYLSHVTPVDYFSDKRLRIRMPEKQ